MLFQPSPPPPGERPPTHRGPIALLFLAAGIAALSTRWPWVQIKFERLFPGVTGPVAWQTKAGFTCLCTSLLVAVMALAESGTPESLRAVRPGSLMLVSLAVLALGAEWLAGPGELRGASAVRTFWFHVACFAVPLLFLVCWRRYRSMRTRPEPT
ncbi:MAG: hypothetical protein U1E73_08380 [Planctomycetota bacterium]